MAHFSYVDRNDGNTPYSQLNSNPPIAEAIDSRTLVADLILLLEIPPDFSIDVTLAMPTLYVPKTPFMLVFRNILSYAVKCQQRPGGRLIVSGEEDGAMAVFTVSDDGTEQPISDHDRLALMSASPFTLKNESANPDMSMAFVQKTVALHGGKLHVHSTPGKEAFFRFTWPKAIAPST